MAGKNIIGARVHLARKKAKPRLTQADIAARLQIKGIRIDRAGVSKIEIGYREVTDIEAKVLAETLGVTVAWLYSEDDILDQKK